MMVTMCHNTDFADGYERVGDNEDYTVEMSKKRPLPMGVNIVFYALSQKKKYRLND